jgi:hypothetical protein
MYESTTTGAGRRTLASAIFNQKQGQVRVSPRNCFMQCCIAFSIFLIDLAESLSLLFSQDEGH